MLINDELLLMFHTDKSLSARLSLICRLCCIFWCISLEIDCRQIGPINQVKFGIHHRPDLTSNVGQQNVRCWNEIGKWQTKNMKKTMLIHRFVALIKHRLAHLPHVCVCVCAFIQNGIFCASLSLSLLLFLIVHHELECSTRSNER